MDLKLIGFSLRPFGVADLNVSLKLLIDLGLRLLVLDIRRQVNKKNSFDSATISISGFKIICFWLNYSSI